MESGQETVEEVLENLKDRANGGYATAFHIRFTTPRFLFQTYPAAWLSHYSENGLVMSDPTVHWGFENEGYIRWSDLADKDTADVLGQAAAHGLAYGVVWAIDRDDSRSVGSFARTDREFDDDECEALMRQAELLHDLTLGLTGLSELTGERLEELDVRVTQSDER